MSAVLVIGSAGDATVRVGMALLMAAATLALALALLLIDDAGRNRLEQRLSGLGLDDQADGDPDRARDPLFEAGLVKEMVGITGRLAERVGILQRVEEKLDQADLPLRAPEALFVYVSGVLTLMVLGALVLSVPAALVLVVAAAVVPVLVLERRRRSRLRTFERQLPDVLALLAGSMRAGFSFTQGLEAVAEEAAEPAGRELRRVFAESRLGRPVEEALEDSATRMQSVDLMWAVMAIRIQREVGGNLAELLDTVASTMNQRERLRGEILALTAEGRMSALILGVFPVVFGAILYAVQPDYESKLFHNQMGIMAMIASAVLAAFGFVWLKKIMKIEV